MTSLEIQALRLRIPGTSPQQAEEIARQVSSQLALRVGSLSASGWREGMQLKLRAPQGQMPEQLSELIVQAILDQIDR